MKALRALYHKLLRFYKRYIPFFEGDVIYYAASLSFYTLLTMVPLLLITVTIMAYLPTSGEYLAHLKMYIHENLLPVQSEYLINFINETFKKRFEIGTAGVFYALFASMLFFYDYDYIVAKMFGTKRKSFFQTLRTYFLLIVIMPFGLALLIFVTTFLQREAHVVFLLFPLTSSELLSLLSFWFAFAIVIKISISVKLSWKILLLSSFVIAFVWSAVHKLFLWQISYNVMYTTLYGSFSSIFFFFLWIYASWIIYLYGLKLSKVLHYKERETHGF